MWSCFNFFLWHSDDRAVKYSHTGMPTLFSRIQCRFVATFVLVEFFETLHTKMRVKNPLHISKFVGQTRKLVLKRRRRCSDMAGKIGRFSQSLKALCKCICGHFSLA